MTFYMFYIKKHATETLFEKIRMFSLKRQHNSCLYSFINKVASSFTVAKIP